MITLKGKIAVVTGGSRGIGAASAILLAQAGCHVAITYAAQRANAQKVCDLISSFDRRCLMIKANVASEKDVRTTIKRVLREFGHIDILENNAGIWKYGAIGSMSAKQWDETMDINLKGTFLFCNEAARVMKRRGGKIINVSSTAGQRGEPFHSHYAASKAGMIGFTKSIAAELAPFRINVNCVAPGWVDTDMSASALRSKKRSGIERTIPRGKVASAEDVAGSILFLASDFSNHLVGSTVSVNGGGVMVA